MDDLSIILPVYNERKSISIVLREWHQILKKNNIIFNFVISEDGSTDGTKEILQKLIAELRELGEDKEELSFWDGFWDSLDTGRRDALLENLESEVRELKALREKKRNSN